jgi:hypothetical protein
MRSPSTETHPSDLPTVLAQALPSFIVLYQFKHVIKCPPAEYLSRPFALKQDMIEAAVAYARRRHTRNRSKAAFDSKTVRYRLSRGIPYFQAETRESSSYDKHARYSVITTVSRVDLPQCEWMDEQRYPLTLKESAVSTEGAVHE